MLVRLYVSTLSLGIFRCDFTHSHTKGGKSLQKGKYYLSRIFTFSRITRNFRSYHCTHKKNTTIRCMFCIVSKRTLSVSDLTSLLFFNCLLYHHLHKIKNNCAENIVVARNFIILIKIIYLFTPICLLFSIFRTKIVCFVR